VEGQDRHRRPDRRGAHVGVADRDVRHPDRAQRARPALRGSGRRSLTWGRVGAARIDSWPVGQQAFLPTRMCSWRGLPDRRPHRQEVSMQTDIHPEYNAVVFRDLASGETFLTRSTVTSEKTIELDGETYPVIDVEISSASHPFYTGKQRIMDS